jgi:ATP adenylyltransferase
VPDDDVPDDDVTTEPADALAGEPDGFDRLWVPHRMAYIGGADRPTDDAPGDGCPFCRAPGLTDEQGLVVGRGRVTFALLNLYPYNAGHVLVCPYRHVSDLTDLTDDEAHELTDLTRTAMRALRLVSGPRGFNVGMNLGQVAGAGIAAHLHQHVVPRWPGDSNFLPIVARTRALPELLGETRARLADAWTRAADGGTR